MSKYEFVGATVTAYFYDLNTDTVTLRLLLKDGETIDMVHVRWPVDISNTTTNE